MVWWELILSFLAGSLLGVFFFGGLWWTVQRLPDSKSPALLALTSFVIRTAAVLGVFYLILTELAGMAWPRLAATLVGFILLRVITVSRARPRERSSSMTGGTAPSPPTKEAEKE
jgi:F1F0 ATPase subunit 2